MTRGSIRVGLVLTLLVAAGALLVLVMTGEPRAPLEPAAAAGTQDRTTPDGEAGRGAESGQRTTGTPDATREPPGRETPRTGPYDELSLRGGGAPDKGGAAPEPRFRGRGTLRGHVQPDGAAPESWTLVVEPSRVFAGREHASARRLELEGGELGFVLEDLPLGAYDLIPQAPGRSGMRTPIVLDTSSPEAYVVLRLLESARLDGRFVDHEGLPAAELPLTLVLVRDRTERATLTDALGGFSFEGLEDGAYELVVGSPLNPTVPARTLRIASPGMRLPDVELPPLATLHVVLADGADQRLIVDGEVRASSPGGGSFGGSTNAYGRVSGRWLKPGRWRVRSSAEGFKSRRDTVDLAPGQELTLPLEMFP